MITEKEITEIGNFNKPHGINGEIAATLDIDDVEALSCIVVNVDGINVPFFIENVRPKNNDTVLLKIEGINSEFEVKPFVNKTIYALRKECDSVGDGLDEEADGFYASDFIGFSVVDETGERLGEITDIDDNTQNVLFVVEAPGRKAPLFIPVADEFITDINIPNKIITMDLPQGMTSL